MLGRDERGLALDLGEVVVHLGEVVQRADDRVADDVGEAHLAAARAAQVVVDDDPVVGHQLGRDGPHARRGGHAQRRLHVQHDPRRGTAQRGRAGRGSLRVRLGRLGSRRRCVGLLGCGLLRRGLRTVRRPAWVAACPCQWARLQVRQVVARSVRRPHVRASWVRRGLVPACNRRRSRATPRRRCPDRRGSARTCPRRATRSCRNPLESEWTRCLSTGPSSRCPAILGFVLMGFNRPDYP